MSPHFNVPIFLNGYNRLVSKGYCSSFSTYKTMELEHQQHSDSLKASRGTKYDENKRSD